jgi:hypothetical protein
MNNDYVTHLLSEVNIEMDGETSLYRVTFEEFTLLVNLAIRREKARILTWENSEGYIDASFVR